MITTAPPRPFQALVLIGAGHAHLEVLRDFARTPPARCRLTLVVDQERTVYSSMVPGYVAGQYRDDELAIDVVALARRAGANVLAGSFRAIDFAKMRLLVEGFPPLHYDLASLNIGASAEGLGLPGVREHALARRPLSGLVARVRAGRDAGHRSPQIVVAGGGAAGVELAACSAAGFRGSGAGVTLVHGGARLLPGASTRFATRAERALTRRGVQVMLGRRVVEAHAHAVRLHDGARLPSTMLFWATGAAPHPVLAASGLPLDARGFIAVRRTLQLAGRDALFAAGDAASFVEFPGLAKAGVHAVREGALLAANLRAALAGKSLKAYRPPADFLTLLNLGDGSAIGEKYGVSFEGRWVMRWKDWIDRRYLRRFRAG